MTAPSCHSGLPRSGKSGIHNPCAGVMDSGLLASLGPGMTRINEKDDLGEVLFDMVIAGIASLLVG